ncbi:MAG: DUF4907 domain-containing protein [Deltaproteobacteria bacterium]
MSIAKVMTTVLLAGLCILFIDPVVPAVALSAEEANLKETIREKDAQPAKEANQDKNSPQLLKQELKKEENKSGKEAPKQSENPYANAEITIKIIPSIKKTFGYDILVFGRPLIHQPSIPGLPGNEGFKTRKRAQTVAEFVVMKIRKNEMPPTVTIEDLGKMGVLK